MLLVVWIHKMLNFSQSEFSTSEKTNQWKKRRIKLKQWKGIKKSWNQKNNFSELQNSELRNHTSLS
jgi:hypothetical protein